MELNDQQLLQNWCARRDAESFQIIVQRHAAMVYHTALRILKNRVDAEDTTQACFEILVAAKEPAKIRSLGAWLHGMVTKRSLNVIRTNQRRDAREDQYARETNALEDSKDWQEIYPLIDDAIQSLDEQYRFPIVAHFLGGQSHGDVARNLSVSRSTVTKRIQHGVQQVETILKEKGVAPTIGLASILTAQLSQAQTVSPSLISNLGKLALGQGEAIVAAQTAAHSAAGILAKTGVAAALIVVAATVALWLYPDPILPSDSNQPVTNDTDTTATRAIASNSGAGAFGGAARATRNAETAASVEQIPMTDPAYVSGYVFDATGATVAGARVDAKWYSGSDDATTNEEGLFEIPIPKNTFGEGHFVLVRQITYRGRVYEIPYAGYVEGNTLGGYLDSQLGQAPVTGERVGEGSGALGVWNTMISYDGEDHAGLLILETNDQGLITGEWEDDAGPPVLTHIEVPDSLELSASFEKLKSFPASYEFSAAGREDVILHLIPAASVAGKVIRSDGTPLPNWRVALYKTDSEWSEVVDSDDNGNFDFSGIMPAEYQVFARNLTTWERAEGPDAFELREGEEKTGVEIVYEHRPGQMLSGSVTSSDGEPIEGVLVLANLEIRPAKNKGPASFQDETDAQGRYVLEGIPDEPGVLLRMQVITDDYLHAHLAHVLVDGNERNFTLEKYPTIQGRVTDATTGLPIEKFHLIDWSGGSAREAEYIGRLNRRSIGRFPDGVFAHRAEGYNDVAIAVSAPGYLTGVVYLDPVSPGEAVQQVNIRLHPSTPIKGTVLDTNGKPVRGARIYLGYPLMVAGDSIGSYGGQQGVAQSKSDGSFSITGYGESQMVVSAHKPGYAPTWTELTSHSAHVNLVMTRGTRIEGQITYRGTPVKTRESSVTLRVDEATIAQVYVDRSGRFAFENVPSQNLTLGAGLTKENVRLETMRDIFVTAGGARKFHIDFNISYDSFIEGKLTVDGRTNFTAMVQAIVQFDNGDRVRYLSETGEDGTYRVGPLPAAMVELGALWILREDGSYVEPDFEWVATDPDETQHHDINIVTD
jgi:RNA polymerase sigma-70 factor (ECF subfamily)